MNFQKITIKDLNIIKPFFNYNDSRICDFTVGGLFMWKDYFNTEFAINGECLYLRQYFNGDCYYFLPLSKDVKSDFKYLINSLSDNEINFCVYPSDYFFLLEENHLKYTVKEERGFFDYLYKAEDLALFSGKKYSPQRNLIHQFNRAYPDYKFIGITGENVPLLAEFLKNDYKVDYNASAYEIEEEKKVLEVLNNFETYNFFGSYLTCNNIIFGFSLAEKINDTIYIHIEKARKDIKGAYQTLVYNFAKKYSDNALYINREEDMNDLGLQKSKLSYHPIKLLEKYTITIKK
ncbi:MAG: DUF2156 domain-containing protein [Clostridia bacterium]|nr:DUF2156 domain-containing protein [Clostridia bacterium]